MEFGDGDVERELVRAQVRAALLGEPATPVFLGRFELRRRLGQGASGTVFEAFDPLRGHKVALKCLGRIDSRAVARFKREFRALAGLSHPNLVTLYELFSEPGQWFFSMELVEGTRFDEYARPNGRLDHARLRTTLVELIRAVQALHQSGKLHCDLKSSNVLVTVAGRVVVLDLDLTHDLALDAGVESVRSGLVGTPGYIAPEQATGGQPSLASDWYSAGVMLFEALTGRLPFLGHPLAVLREKQDRAAPDPRELCDDLSESLSNVCVGLLERDPAVRLSGDRALGMLQERASTVADYSFGAAAVFVGRTPELEVLEKGFARVQAGSCATILIAGRSGMGKSALLDRFAARVAPHAVVLRGRCYEREALPYKVFDAVIDELARYFGGIHLEAANTLSSGQLAILSQLFPILRPLFVPHVDLVAPATDDRRAQRKDAFAALKDLLRRIASQTPLVLLVDDLQWGDADSARMLEHVLGPPDPPPLLLVGAYRVEEEATSDFLRAALASRSATESGWSRISLGPLEHEDSLALVDQLTGDTRTDADRIVREAQGVPFFIAELAAHACKPGALTPTDRRPVLEQLILQRARAMTTDAQRLLTILSIAVGPLEYAIAARAAGTDPMQTMALRALCRERLVRTQMRASSEIVEVYHDRIRETLAANCDERTLRDAHAAIVDAFDQLAIDDPDRLWTHRLAAGDRLGAGKSAAQAARAAGRQLAFNRAAQLYERAIELLGEAPELDGLYAEYGDALANAGRGTQAAEAYTKAAAALAEKEAHGLRCKAVQQYVRSGRFNPGLPLAQAILRDVGITLPAAGRTTLAHFLWQRARLKLRGMRRVELTHAVTGVRTRRLEALQSVFQEMVIADSLVGATLQACYLREALDAGHPEHVLRGLVWEVFNLALLGHSANEHDAKRLIPAIDALAATIDTPYSRGMAEFAHAARLTWTGRLFDDARAAAERARTIFANGCPGTFWERAMADYLIEICMEWSGSRCDQIAATHDRLRDAADRDDRYVMLLLMLGAPYARCAVDDIEGSRAFLDQHKSLVGEAYTGFRHHWVIRTVENGIFAHDSLATLEFMNREWHAFRRSYLAHSDFVRSGWHYFHARCAVAAYDEVREPRVRRMAVAAIRPLRQARNVYGVFFPLFWGSIHAGEGRRNDAAAALDHGRKLAVEHQSRVAVFQADYRIAELNRDEAARARIEAQLQAEGIVNPVRWLQAHLPAVR